MHYIKTADSSTYKDLFKKLVLPESDSHKGQNGKVLIVGGSSLFHAASLWAAEVAAHFADMVHYASTEENNEIFTSLKKKFRNGIIVSREDLFYYAAEDDVTLIGPGLVRDDGVKLHSESAFTRDVTQKLIIDLPVKKFVFDAGSLQMMQADWLLKLHTKPVITPHQLEFERLFQVKIKDLSFDEKVDVVKGKAKEFKIVILLKAVKDIITDGETVYVIEGGNAGLTKGGSGDILAGLTTSFFAKNDALSSAVMASVLLKKSADSLYASKGYWYNMLDLIDEIPRILAKIVSA